MRFGDEEKSLGKVSVEKMSELKRRWEKSVTDELWAREMSTENITKYQNGTGFISDKSKESGLGVFQIVLLSLTIISSIVLVFSLVYYMLRKRSLDELRHRLVPLYHFDPGECEDWEDELLEDSKKEIIRNGHKYYRSMSSSV